MQKENQSKRIYSSKPSKSNFITRKYVIARDFFSITAYKERKKNKKEKWL